MGDTSGARRRVDEFIGVSRAALVPDISLHNLEELHVCAQQLGALGHSRRAGLAEFTRSAASGDAAFGAQLFSSGEGQHQTVRLA